MMDGKSALIDPYGAAYLQRRLMSEFALAVHLGVEVECAGDESVVLRAPLVANANHKGTAFGGSLFSLAALAGWAWLTRYVAQQGIAAEAVIQDAQIDYLLPVSGELRAVLQAPNPLEIERFRKMLRRAGRGRLLISVDIHSDESLATRFSGVFAAAMRSD
jgi:thioesterase domain-containing protein